MIADLRFALRIFAKSRSFTATAVLVLALGIGLNTAAFNAVWVMAFSGRPFPDSSQLAQLHTQDTKRPKKFRAFSYDAFRALQERDDLFRGVLAQRLTLVVEGNGDEARRALGNLVSANFFEVLGARLERGRAFTDVEAGPGAAAPVVVVSHDYWRKAEYDPELVGSAILINGRSFTVVGIAPAGFNGTMMMLGPEFYFPLGVYESLSAGNGRSTRKSLASADTFGLFLTARLLPQTSRGSALAALTGVTESLRATEPTLYEDSRIVLGMLPKFFPDEAPFDNRPIQLLAVVFLGLTASVLLIVSLNLAGLFLARGHARRKELAIRLAVGGTRARLVRQLLVEGLALALIGGAIGAAGSVWATRLGIAAITRRLPFEIPIALHSPGAIIASTLLLCGLATMFFAFGPALKLARRDLLMDLQQQAGEDVVARRCWLPRHPLIVAQIALSLALMIGSGLFARMVDGAIGDDVGVDFDRTLVVEFDASLTGWDRTRTLDTFRVVSERLTALPGIRSASVASTAPYTLSGDERSVRRAGTQPAEGAKPTTPSEGLVFRSPYSAVGADYFATVGLPLLRGRAFTQVETDFEGAPRVAIIDESLASLIWPGEDALGRRIEWADRDSPASGDAERDQTIEIIGIVPTVHPDLFQKDAPGALFLPFAQGFRGSVYFFLSSERNGESALTGLKETVRQELRRTAPEVPFAKVLTFREQKDASLELWIISRVARTAAAFSLGAALIAVIGLYGAQSYSVSRRAREIGIRLALGADSTRVRNQLLQEGFATGVWGVALGSLLGAALGRGLASLIAEIDAFDTFIFGLAPVAILACAFVASWFPARLAAVANPLDALRKD